jgi:hypothetical protein
MKTATRWAMAWLVLLGFTAVADAQTTDTVTKVPFAFRVGTTMLPKDTYTISRISGQSGAFLLRGEQHAVVILTQPDGVSGAEAPQLIFHRYGDQYFLHEARLIGKISLRLPKSRAEVDVAERIAQRALPEVVTVPALTK